MDDSTPVITLEEAIACELEYKKQLEAEEELDRFIGTWVSYGGYMRLKPTYSWFAKQEEDYE